MLVVFLGVVFSSKLTFFGEEAVGQPPACFRFTSACEKAFADTGTAEDTCDCLESQEDPDCVLYEDVTVQEEYNRGECGCPVQLQSCIQWAEGGFADQTLMCTCLEEQPKPDCTPDGSAATLRQIKENQCDCTIMTPECQASMADPKSQEKKCTCFFSQEENMECKPKPFEGGTRSFFDLASAECGDFLPTCIDEADYSGGAGECAYFESAKYQGLCRSDNMKLMDNEIEEVLSAWEACSQCGFCRSLEEVTPIEPEGETQFCADKRDQEFVPLCGSCLYSSQCIGHVDSFNPEDRAHEIYCCPRTKMCMLAREVPGYNYKMGACTPEDIVATRGFLGNPSWQEKSASCVHTRADNRCSERHRNYPNECSCEDDRFPAQWVECPTQSSLVQMDLVALVNGNVITKALALIGACSIVYAGIQKLKSMGAEEDFEKIEEPEDI